MNLIADTSANEVEIVREHTALTKFLEPHTPALIWQRPLPADVEAWLSHLDPDHLPDGRVILAREEIAETLTHLCDVVDMPKGKERTWFERDVAEMAFAFIELMRCPFVRLRLDVIETNACRKFHIDAVTARLVCTYRGTGTQYGLAHPKEEPAQVFTTPTGAPIFLKGTRWPEPCPTPLLHRSPPIEGTGETRLVLVLDPVFEPEDEV